MAEKSETVGPSCADRVGGNHVNVDDVQGVSRKRAAGRRTLAAINTRNAARMFRRVAELVRYVSKKRRVTSNEIAAHLGVFETTARDYAKRAVRDGLIDRALEPQERGGTRFIYTPVRDHAVRRWLCGPRWIAAHERVKARYLGR